MINKRKIMVAMINKHNTVFVFNHFIFFAVPELKLMTATPPHNLTKTMETKESGAERESKTPPPKATLI